MRLTQKDKVCVCGCKREKVNACVKNKEGRIGTKRQKACCGVTYVSSHPP